MKNEERKMKKVKTSCLRLIFTFFFFTFSLFFCYGQVASRTDGVNVFYYDSLHDAVSAADGTFDQPDEITLLADIVLDEPLTVDDGKHIRLVVGGDNRTIRRSGNLVEYPVIWVNGDGASLSLGKPDMARTRTEPLSGEGSPLHELIIDGGFLNNPPIEAHCPLVAVSGPDSKLIMHDKVTLQNNKNIGAPPGKIPLGASHYEHGAGVFIRTEEDLTDRQAEFIMRGGTIRGNTNLAQHLMSSGGGVLIAGFGIFTMEDGVIMNNAAQILGGGFHTGSRGSFKKTGGIIYGSDAPAAYRNTAIEGLGRPKTYGHALSVSIINPSSQFRNDTVGENDNLSYIGVPRGNGIFRTGDKWDNPDKAFRRMLVAVILPFLALTVCGFLIMRKRYLKRRNKIIQEAADAVPYIDLRNMGLTNREKDLCELLLTDRPLKEISTVLGKGYPGTYKNARKLYVKLGIKDRTELMVRVKTNEK